MIDFAILALPRSGTTWAANWLTGYRHICLHDPLQHYTQEDLLRWSYRNPKETGVSCTGLWMHPEWVETHIRRWIIIDRPVHEVQSSLFQIGLPPMGEQAIERFRAMPGRRFQMTDLFKPESASEIQRLLMPHRPFDIDRHRELCKMEINPRFQNIHPDPAAVKQWMQRAIDAFNPQTQSAPRERS